MIQFVGRDAYKQFWNFSKDEKENLATQLAIELPALRGKVGASQEEIASAVGISRQTYSAYENRTRPIPWSLYLALLFYFDYIPSTHYMIRSLNYSQMKEVMEIRLRSKLKSVLIVQYLKILYNRN